MSVTKKKYHAKKQELAEKEKIITSLREENTQLKHKETSQETEIKKLKEESTRLKHEDNAQEPNNQDRKTEGAGDENTNYKDKYERLSAEFKKLQQEGDRMQFDKVNQLENEIETLKQTNETQIRMKEDEKDCEEIGGKRMENENGIDIVEDDMHWKQKYQKLLIDTGKDLAKDVSKDGTNCENINSKYRPSVLIEQYAHLTFQASSNIRSALMDSPGLLPKMSEKVARYVVCALYKAAENQATCTLEKMVNCCYHLMTTGHTPANGSMEISRFKSAEFEELKELISSIQLRNVSEIDVPFTIQESIAEAVAATEVYARDEQCTEKLSEFILSNDDIKKFTHDVNRLAWCMALQKPPMYFDELDTDIALRVDYQEPIPIKGMLINKETELLVHSYLEPTLLHGSKIVKKARVFVYSPIKDNEEEITSDSELKTASISDIQVDETTVSEDQLKQGVDGDKKLDESTLNQGEIKEESGGDTKSVADTTTKFEPNKGTGSGKKSDESITNKVDPNKGTGSAKKSDESTANKGEPNKGTDGKKPHDSTTNKGEPNKGTDGKKSEESTANKGEPNKGTDGKKSHDSTTNKGEPNKGTDGKKSEESTTSKGELNKRTDNMHHVYSSSQYRISATKGGARADDTEQLPNIRDTIKLFDSQKNQ